MAEVIGIASLAFGLPSLLEICVRLGKHLLEGIKDLCHMEQELPQTILRLQAHAEAHDRVLVLVQSLHMDLHGTSLNLLTSMLQRLRDILLKANEGISKYIATERGTLSRALRRLSLSTLEISEIRKVCNEMAEWERLIEMHLVAILLERDINGSVGAYKRPLPQMLSKTTSKGGDVALMDFRQDDEYPPEDLEPDPIPHSSIRRYAHNRSVLVEYRAEESLPAPESQSLDNVSRRQVILELATMLHAADGKQMHILQCDSIFFRPVRTMTGVEHDRFELCFTIPKDYDCSENVRTLRDLLTDPTRDTSARHPLDHRLRLARNLAQAVLYVHSGNFVHKNIRPENILVIRSMEQINLGTNFPEALGEAFLVGFDHSRSEDQVSGMHGDEDLPKNLYRHPKRWGQIAETRFNMFHDIYSLGVVMLEIGLWQWFVKFNENGRYIFEDSIKREMSGGNASMVQRRLIKIASRYLPITMGSTYASIVVACLQSVEDRLQDEGEEGIQVAVGTAFVERVVQRLENIKL